MTVRAVVGDAGFLYRLPLGRRRLILPKTTQRPRGGVVTQRSAKPFTPVQFRAWPPSLEANPSLKPGSGALSDAPSGHTSKCGRTCGAAICSGPQRTFRLKLTRTLPKSRSSDNGTGSLSGRSFEANAEDGFVVARFQPTARRHSSTRRRPRSSVGPRYVSDARPVSAAKDSARGLHIRVRTDRNFQSRTYSSASRRSPSRRHGRMSGSARSPTATSKRRVATPRDASNTVITRVFAR